MKALFEWLIKYVPSAVTIIKNISTWQIQEVISPKVVVNEYHSLVSRKSKDNERYKNTVYWNTRSTINQNIKTSKLFFGS